MAVNEWKWLEIDGNSWKLQEVAGMGVNGLTVLEWIYIAGIGCNGRTMLGMTRNG